MVSRVEHQVTRTWSPALVMSVSIPEILQYGGGSSFGNSFAGDVNVYRGRSAATSDLHASFAPTANRPHASGRRQRLNSSFGAINYTFNGPGRIILR